MVGGGPTGLVNGSPIEDAVERSEHRARVLSLRKGAGIGVVAWPSFAIADWFIVELIEPGRVWYYATIRVVGMALLVASYLFLRRRPVPSPAAVGALDVVVTTSLSVLVTFQCLEFRGIVSPLVLGVVTVLVCRSAVLSEHWRRGLLPIGTAAIAHPALLSAFALFDPSVAAQFRDPATLAMFGLHQSFLFGIVGLIVAGGHAVWGLRRQVFEARSLGRYKLEQRIGEGGMGEVWRAHHRFMKRDVAVKILRHRQERRQPRRRPVRARGASDRGAHASQHGPRLRLRRDGRRASGTTRWSCSRAPTSAACSRPRARLSTARAVRLVVQAAQALAEAHGRGIVHRDMKPENLFITSVEGAPELVKVLDFGLAKVARQALGPDLTQESFAMGTPSYMSPEVIQSKEADARSDVYALGGVLYHLLAGEPPFRRPEIRDILLAHLREAPVAPSAKIGRPLPPDLERVVLRCLDKDPDKRFPTAAALAEALLACDSRGGAARQRSARRLGDRDLLTDPRRRRAAPGSARLFVAEVDLARPADHFTAKLEVQMPDLFAADRHDDLHSVVRLEPVVARVPPVEVEPLDERLLRAVVHERAHVRDEPPRAVLHVVEEDVKLEITRRAVERRDHVADPLALGDGVRGRLLDPSRVGAAREPEQTALGETMRDPLLHDVDLGAQPALTLRRGGDRDRDQRGGQGERGREREEGTRRLHSLVSFQGRSENPNESARPRGPLP